MRRSVRLAEKQTKPANIAHEKPKAKKSRSDNRITTIVTMDTGTMLEVFKYLNYCQLAKTGLVSKRFSNLIRIHRHRFALLYVDQINTHSKPSYASIRDGRTTVRKTLNHEQLDRLFTDPFIRIRSIGLTSDDVILNLLSAAISPGRRLQCNEIRIIPEDNIKNFMTWIHDHVRCHELLVYYYMDSSHNQELLNFLVTGAQCTLHVKEFSMRDDLFEIYIDFVQKFMEHKKRDEFQFVEFITSNMIVKRRFINELDLLYPKCIVEKETDDSTTYVFEFNNNDIGKKLKLTVIDDNQYDSSDDRLLMNIEDL